MLARSTRKIRNGPVLQCNPIDADPGSSRLAGRGPPLSLSPARLGAAGRDSARHPAGRVRRPRLPRRQNGAADGVSERLSWRPGIVARVRHRLDQYRHHARDAGSETKQCRQAVLRQRRQSDLRCAAAARARRSKAG